MRVSVAFLTETWHKPTFPKVNTNTSSWFQTVTAHSSRNANSLQKMSLEICVWIYSFCALKRCLGGGLSDRDTIHWEETSLTASPCQLVNYSNGSALACTYVMVAHVANCFGCRMINQLIMIQLTISRGRLTRTELWNMKETSIMIWKNILNYIIAYLRASLVCLLFTPSYRTFFFVS